MLAVVATYLGLGVIFAMAYVTTGVQRLDALAREAGWGFRLVILPGAVAFWPLLLWRWVKGVRT